MMFVENPNSSPSFATGQLGEGVDQFLLEKKMFPSA